MENEKIIEWNKLIAEFMEYLQSGPYAVLVHTLPDYWSKAWLYENLQFHSSWDWLMPVVEKIEREFTVRIIRYSDELSNICEIETTEKNPLQITYIFGYDYDGKTKIDVVFDAVIEFIKWYNQSHDTNSTPDKS